MLAHDKPQITEIKKQDAFEILVNSKWYNENEDYQKPSDSKLTKNPLKELFKSFNKTYTKND